MYKGNRREEVGCSGTKNICIEPAKHRNYRQVLNLRSRYRRKTKNRLPPKNYRRIALLPNNYRRIALPPKKYRHILAYRFRQSRYRQNWKTAYRQKVTAVWQYRPACVRLKHRYRPPP